MSSSALTKHDNSLFTKTTGKKGPTDTLHFITTGIEKNINNDFVQDMERVVTKFSATFPICLQQNFQYLGREKKAVPRTARKRRACFIFLSLRGSPIYEYDPLTYGIQQVEGIDYETLALFTSATDKAC